MSAKSDNVSDSLAEQLTSFDSRLHGKAGDVKLLAEIQEGIGDLLADDQGSETEIRRVLRQRYKAGALRAETYQLVDSILDKLVSEGVPTEPKMAKQLAATRPAAEEPDDHHLTLTDVLNEAIEAPVEDRFSSTTVLDEGPVQPETADDRVQVGSVLRDRFLLQKRVHGGSMGVVYKALDRRLAEAGTGNHWVAIKVLTPKLAKNGDALRALQQEAAKGRCLLHPNIVRFIDLDRDDDLYFIVMEWLDGRNLAEILDDPESKSVEPRRAFEIVRQVGDALAYAHRCGIVHADVKPGNIIITPDGDAKLFDFGVARVRQTQLSSTSSFDPGTLGALTPAYSSMQVLTGEDPAPSDDVFSLACLLYRLLAGYRVFGPRNAAEAAEEGMKPQRLPMLTDTQWNAVKKALSYARVTRFDSMQQFLDALNSNAPAAIKVDIEPSYAVEESGGMGKWLLAAVVVIAGAGFAANELGYLEDIKARFGDLQLPQLGASSVERTSTSPEVPTVADEKIIEVAPQPELEIQTYGEQVVEDGAPVSDEPIEAPVLESEPLIDFTTYPAAELTVPVSLGGGTAESYTLTLLEDSDEADIEFVRQSVAYPLTLRIEEIGYSGSRSPWAGGQYAFSNEGVVEFPEGQARGRITLSMASDVLRESDQQSTLRVRDVDSPASELATITVFLRDDDQRAFEAQLPANTVAFAAGQASVSEADPAAQLDVLRFNPDNSTIVRNYRIDNITASRDEDFFPPSSLTIVFGPGQRSARLLIPLVQDSLVERDEAFVVELDSEQPVTQDDVHQRIVVFIRDDE